MPARKRTSSLTLKTAACAFSGGQPPGAIRSQVLPGFRFRRTDLLNLPDPAGLAPDETYAGYVIPGHRDAVNRAEEATAARRHAEERAEAEAAARRHSEEQIQALKAEIA